jgi:hypothetical protein
VEGEKQILNEKITFLNNPQKWKAKKENPWQAAKDDGSGRNVGRSERMGRQGQPVPFREGGQDEGWPREFD